MRHPNDKAQLSATLSLNDLLLCKRKKKNTTKCYPVLRMLMFNFFSHFLIFLSHFHF